MPLVTPHVKIHGTPVPGVKQAETADDLGGCRCVRMSAMGLSEVETRISRAIEERAGLLLEDLSLHVGIPTGRGLVSGLDETRSRLTERLEALGATTRIVPGDDRPSWLQQLGTGAPPPPPPTAVCSREGHGPRILVAGHLDTVHDPQSSFNTLTIAPSGETATGPGCVDMKGGLVIAVAALEVLEEAGVAANWTFLMNSDEETGSYHSEAVLREQAACHDVGLALEPALAGGELAIERLGSGQFAIETHGRSAHVGRAFEDGVSAVTCLAECLVRISEMPDVGTGRIINVGPVEGGLATNAVPHFARAWGNVRFPDEATSAELGAMLDGLQTDADAMPRIVVHRSFNRPAKKLTPQVQRVADAARAVAEDLGQQLPFASTGGVCDGNILQDAGLPTIDTLGVRGGALHTEDEWIELPSLTERCQLLAILLSRLAGADSNL